MNLKEYLTKNKINPVEFAVKSGMSVTSIYRYLRGERASMKKAQQIKQFTEGQVSLESLRMGNDHDDC